MKLYKWYKLQNDNHGYPCHIDKTLIGNYGATEFNICKTRLKNNNSFFLLNVEKPDDRDQVRILKILFNGKIRYILIDYSYKDRYFFLVDNETAME